MRYSYIFKLIVFMAVGLLQILPSYGQKQIQINRVEMMPNKPEPFILRNWRQVALGYDSLVFNTALMGEFLPLTRVKPASDNPLGKESFHQHTFVGDTTRNESINTFMAIVGATLCGVDKRSHYGKDWVLMAGDWYNESNGWNMYTNRVGKSMGYDWWYDLIPNVLFYQLHDLYGDVGDFKKQFTIVADRWVECVVALGGELEPRRLPNFNYRAFNFITMKPLDHSVPEPEAAGAIGWLLYMAYQNTGDAKYLKYSDLCLEAYSGFDESPVYELQYLYGTVAAARMNAELGKDYDLNKMMNWCFDVGPLRQWEHTLGWGAVVGKWNGMDASGLLAAISKEGNTDFGDFSFIMNTFQQCGILAPIARYDSRYARALGKYLLNASNSMRWFYAKYLPEENQDCYEWSAKNDPNSYIAYEALRQFQDGKSPFATGDALKHGWAKTNLSLYSSAPVGYLGGILENTNIEAILKVDLIKTDFFRNDAYPTYLYYNPYSESKNVEVDLGNIDCLVYEMTTNNVLAKSISGKCLIKLPSDQAVVLVFAPAHQDFHKADNKAYVGKTIVDYNLDKNPELSKKDIKLYKL
jgi:hypothetical protein